MKCLKCLADLDKNSHYGMHPQCFCGWFMVEAVCEFTNLNRKSSDSNSKYYANDTSFFQGKFKKYSAELNNRPFLLKMQQPEVPALPVVEYLCNKIGSELGIPVADFFIVSFQGELVFVTENFMSKFIGADLQHICHYRDNEQHTCADLINLIKVRTNSLNQVNIFIDMILFDALIGNHDRHGRNIAFIVRPNKIMLSPIYDNVSYLGIESENMLQADFNPTGKISTSSTDEPSMKDYVRELKLLGYADQVYNFYKLINITKLNLVIDNSFCSDIMKQAIKKLVAKRYGELKDEL